jgi:hypothetical protein
MRIRDGDSSDLGWKKVGYGIRDKHPGSATLLTTLPRSHQSLVEWLYNVQSIAFRLKLSLS